jgi:hypothetical protein
MKLLFDECVPRKVKFLFADGGHECETVRDAGFTLGTVLTSGEIKESRNGVLALSGEGGIKDLRRRDHLAGLEGGECASTPTI